MKYTITKRVKQVILKRHATPGIDWGVDRKLLATDPDGKMLIWWTGHTAWISRGQSGHNPGELTVQVGRDTKKCLDHEKVGETRLTRVLKSEIGIAWIREHFIDDDEVITALDARGTIDIKAAK